MVKKAFSPVLSGFRRLNLPETLMERHVGV
jgi:hypothetical protein